MRPIAKIYIYKRKILSATIFPLFNFFAYLFRLPSSIFDNFLLLALKPEELKEYSKTCYANLDVISFWNSMNKEGFRKWEEEVLKKDLKSMPKGKKGKCLVMGSGCGRESVEIAKLGFEVTGIEEIQKMIDIAKTEAIGKNLNIKYRRQDFTSPNFPSRSFDLIVLFFMMYSSIPSSEMRVEMLKKINKILKPEGTFIFEFFFDPTRSRGRLNFFKKSLIKILRGNKDWQPGDGLTKNGFFRFFSQKSEIEDEVSQAGLSLIKIAPADPMINSQYAIVQKSLEKNS